MNEEEKKAIELLKQPPDFSLRYYERENAIEIVLNLIKKQQKELEKQNKVIDKMAEDIRLIIGDENYLEMSKEETIEKYTNLVEKC